MKKFTKATLKKFIKDNAEKLYIRVDTSFDWMTDWVESTWNKAIKKIDSEKIDFTNDYTFWIEWLWLVWWSRDRFEQKENKVKIWNCCGSCLLVAI